MYRLFRLTAVAAAVMFLFAGMKLQPAAAQSGNGVTGDSTYESPTFGYEVEWGGDWRVLEDATAVSDTGDSLALFSDEYGSRVDISSFFSNDRTPEDFLAGYEDFLAGEYADFESEPMDSADPDAVAILATYSLGETPIDDYIEVRSLDDALIVTSIKTSQGLGLITAILVIGQIQIDGEPALPSFGSSEETEDPEEEETPVEEEEETPEEEEETPEEEEETPEEEEDPVQGGGVDGNTYVAPTFGVFVEFDEDVWTVSDELPADENDGRDLLLLEAEDIPARLYLEAYDTITKASDCIEAASEEAVGDIDAATPLEDEDGEVIEGSSRGVAYAAYSFETEDGDELAAYVECRALPEGAGVFVITMITTEAEFETAYAELEPILESIDVEGGSSSSSNNNEEEEETPEEEEETPEEEEETPEEEENNSGSSAGEYESPTYGFVVEFDDQTWEVTDESSRGDTDEVVLESDDVVLTIIAIEAGSGDDAESCVEDYAADYDEELSIIENTDDEPVAGEDDFGYYTLYGYIDADDETQSVYVECGESPDGDYLVLFVAESLLEDFEVVLDDVIPMIEEIQF